MFVDQVDESCLVPFNEAIDASKGRLELANSEQGFRFIAHGRLFERGGCVGF